MSFIRRKEDFVCERCGRRVAGTGYTNHCSACLWSKHTDIEPGDRAESCGGAMEPIALRKKSDEWVITHRCTRCGFRRRQRSDESDSFGALIELSRR